MTPKQLLAKYKRQTEIAKTFGFTRAAVSKWFKRGKICYRTQIVVASIDSQFKAVK